MSTIVSSPARPAVRVTLRGVATAEWIKLRSLRSAAWLLAGIVVSIVGIGVMPALGVAVGALPFDGGADPTGGALGGMSAAQLLAGALGCGRRDQRVRLAHHHGDAAAVPRRLPLVGAKAGVVGVVVFVAALGAVLVAVLGAAALLAAAGAPVPAVGPTLARLVVGSALFLAVTAVLGVGFGWLLRSTAGALAGLYAFLFLPSALGLVVPAALPYLPGNAGTAILQVEQVPGPLSPWVGLALYAAYAAARPRGRRGGPRPSRRVILMTAVTPTRHVARPVEGSRSTWSAWSSCPRRWKPGSSSRAPHDDTLEVRPTESNR